MDSTPAMDTATIKPPRPAMCVEPEGLPATSAVAWTVRRELELAEWSAHGRRLGAVSRGVGWWIGDWLRYGNARFGERYVRAARLTGYDVQTLMNMVYVTSRFDPSRRREDLSFSHHAELAALEPAEQERWLSHASSEHLSVRCLREELRRVRRALRAEDSAELDDASRSAAALVCPECGAGVLQPSHDGA